MGQDEKLHLITSKIERGRVKLILGVIRYLTIQTVSIELSHMFITSYFSGQTFRCTTVLTFGEPILSISNPPLRK